MTKERLEYFKKYKAKNREKIAAQKKAWYAKNRDEINKRRKERQSTPEAKATRAEYRRNYILTEEQKRRGVEKSRQFSRNRKIRAVELLGGTCVICGLRDDPAVYDFHHRDPAKKDVHISRLRNWAAIEKELAKCDLVCSNCHRKIHVV